MTDPAPDSTPPPLPARKLRVRVAARAIVLHRDAVLMLASEDPGRPWFFLPGGHVNHGERLAEAVKREVLEETGLQVIVERPLYVREFIAARHARRSVHMPPEHHVLAMVFLCRLDPDRVDTTQSFADLGALPGPIDGTDAVKAVRWIPRAELADVEIMPPHIKRALLDPAFPPAGERGTVEFWPEDDNDSPASPS